MSWFKKLWWVLLIVVVIVFLAIFLSLFLWKQKEKQQIDKQLDSGGTFGYLAIVKNWDYKIDKLDVEFNGNKQLSSYYLDPVQVSVITFAKTADNQLDQIIVKDRSTNDWRTAFCINDKVRIDLGKVNDGVVLKSITNIGPRECK